MMGRCKSCRPPAVPLWSTICLSPPLPCASPIPRPFSAVTSGRGRIFPLRVSRAEMATASGRQ